MSHSFLKNFFLTAAAFACISPSAYATPETLSIHIKTSHYMDMGQLITRIAVGNPNVATVIQLPGSASEFLIVTKDDPGSTALFVWTKDGVRHEYLIVVSPEDPGQAMLIEQAIGLPDVHVKMVGEKVLLTGTVENQYEKNYAIQTARLFVNGDSESSLLVGSGFDTKLKMAKIDDLFDGRDETIEMNTTSNRGRIIDLLQILNPTQIRLEAQIIEIDSNNAKDLGIQYGQDGSGGSFSFGENYDRTASRGVSNITPFYNNPYKWVNQRFGPINATIDALVSNGKARILSRPSLVTLSGEQATIQIGGQVPYTTITSIGTISTEWKDYGIILQFKPIVDARNRISSMIHAEVSAIGEERVNGLPVITTRTADSVINLNSGSPVVIGGLMNSEESKRIYKIPLLGDIPILGEFFKHTSRSRDKHELIVIVTPYIVNEENSSQIPISDMMREWYGNDQKYREKMEKFDFKEPEVQEPEEPEEPPPPRILPPSKLDQNGKLKTDKKSETNKKSKSESKNNDEIVEFRLDKTEIDEPFSSKK